MSYNYLNYVSISKWLGATEVDKQTETDGPKAPELNFTYSLCCFQKRKEKVFALGLLYPWSAMGVLSTRDE